MNLLQKTIIILFFFIPFIGKSQTGQLNPNGVTVVLTANQSIITQVIDAAKEAGKKPGQIPIEVIKSLGINSLYKQIGGWITKKQICRCFDHWSTQRNVGQKGEIQITFLLVEPGESPTDDTPRITVPFMAIKKGQKSARAGNSGSSGYLAPINANGNPTMSYDLFGDGEYVLKRTDCPGD